MRNVYKISIGKPEGKGPQGIGYKVNGRKYLN
jgi:hypothetical protein